MSHALERPLDWRRLCAGDQTLSGQVAVTRCRRLADLLSQADGAVDYRLDFRFDPNLSVPLVTTAVTGSLTLNCQRCLGDFAWSLDAGSTSQLVASEAEAEQVDGAWEPVIIDAAGVVPLALIEDECILGLPLAPSCGCALPDSLDEAPAEAAPEPAADDNPFAVLKQLKS